jgi:hypothetical protein
MKYNKFLELLLGYRKFQRDIDELYSIGIDLEEGKFKLGTIVHKILETSIESHYGKQGWDWVSWFIYESDWGEKEKIGAWDKDENPICYSLESLWECLEKDYSKKKKIENPKLVIPKTTKQQRVQLNEGKKEKN